jgi:hypothetical protein
LEDRVKGTDAPELEKLVRQFEEAQDQGRDARVLCERDRDYYDGNQLTDEEIATLTQRGQPPVVFNRIGPKIDALLGFEQRMRTDPKAFPRTPKHEAEADSVTDAIRYVLDDQRYDFIRSDMAEDLAIEGTTAVSITVRQSKQGYDIVLSQVPWDRFYYDPYSRKRDYRDASYMGVVVWMDADEAEAQFGAKARELVEGVLDNQDWSGETYDDRPRNTAWADSRRKRVRVCQHYFKQRGVWMHAIFCRGGYLMGPAVSPYKDEDGTPECCIVAAAAYSDRDNNRYGIVRRMISPQDEINKRRSKALHYLNSRQVIAERGAVDDVEQARRELSRPDGWVERNPGTEFEVNEPIQMAAGELQLLQEAKNEIDASGVNPALEGDAQAPSGRAQEMLLQNGLAELTKYFGTLRDLNWRVYRAVWNRVRQFWQEERWIRVTDDEKNLRWVGLNIQPTDDFGNPAGPMQNQVAELEVDIILYDAPDSVNIQSEQFQMLVDLFSKAPDRIPLEMVIQASSLRNKDQLLEHLKGQGQPDPAQAQLAQRGAAAEVAKTEGEAAKAWADAENKQADTAKSMVETEMAMTFGVPQPVASDNNF